MKETSESQRAPKLLHVSCRYALSRSGGNEAGVAEEGVGRGLAAAELLEHVQRRLAAAHPQHLPTAAQSGVL